MRMEVGSWCIFLKWSVPKYLEPLARRSLRLLLRRHLRRKLGLKLLDLWGGEGRAGQGKARRVTRRVRERRSVGETT